MDVSQAGHHGVRWSADPPNTQEHPCSVLRACGDHQGRTPTPVGISQAHLHGWHVDAPNTQENTFSVLRPLGDHQRQPRSAQGISQAHHQSWSLDPPNTQDHAFSVPRPLADHQERPQDAARQEIPALGPLRNQCTSVERAIMEKLEKMDMKINHLTSLVQSITGNRRALPQMEMAEEEESGVFPLASIADLDRLEEKLAEKGFMQKMVNRLSLSGGPNMKKTVWRICFKVFTTVVARQLNWCGRGGKKGLRKTNFGALLIGKLKYIEILKSGP
ncbi:uncharacterized protein LOC130410219 [Triplophysa dalaica]|uniref:uncharacterized protein LOC130410219 n=1 Tax=Triplophysa dalaica TaxID=1582913 RepID=UPI0024E02767|nr:uncharacterized protein LOC130410219 [Triplophysa dalaica]